MGNWKEGKYNGLGTYMENNQDLKYGLWENGDHILWFNKETVLKIKNGSKDYIKHLKDEQNIKEF